MHKKIFLIVTVASILSIIGCSDKIVPLKKDNLNIINREILSIDQAANGIKLNNKRGTGLAILESIDFEIGTIELELKGENNPGKSFVGIAFNIQNDSTYEAIYFRPFNFQSKEKKRREHSVQYISHPTNTWRTLRTNHEGQFEAEFQRQPSPDDWFKVKLKIDNQRVSVYDETSKVELLSIKRLNNQKSSKIGLWTGHNSKGEFRKIKVKK